MRRLLVVLAVLAVALAAPLAWLLYTEPGLAWALARAQGAAGGALAIEGVRGSLSGGATLERFRYEQEGLAVECRDAAVALSPLSLVLLAPRVSRLACAELTVAAGPGGEPSGLPSSLALPLRLDIAEARIERLTVRRAGEPVHLTGIAFGYTFGADGHRLRNATLEVESFRISGNVAVGATSPFPVQAELGASRAAAPAVELSATLRGSLEALQVSARATVAGARANVESSIAPFAPEPIENLHANWSELNLHALETRLPRTALAGELNLARKEGAAGLTGSTDIENRLPGTYDENRLPLVSLHAGVQTDLRSARLTGMRIGLGPAGSLSGTGEITAEDAALALEAVAVDLAGLHSRLRPTRLSGEIRLSAGAESQSVTADLRERDVRIALTASRAGDAVELTDVRARARGGELRGHGRLSLAGARPFRANATLSRFDPAAWGNFPGGDVNGTVTASGSLADAMSVDGRFELAASRLHGAPLSGAGRLSLREGRLSAADVVVELGGNRVAARGALGGPGDVLSMRVDAPRLAVVDPRWKGQVAGTAQISGHWREPAVKFDFSGKDLASADALRVSSVVAKGEYAPQPDGPLRLDATAAGISAPGWRVDRVSLEADGTRRAHAIILRAHGQRLDLSARARGGWKSAGGWAGTLEALENRGAYPVALEAPVAIEADAGLLRTGAIAAQLSGGRLQVREFRYESGRVSTQGEFSQLGAGVLLALAGVSPAVAGTLKLSGAWALTRSPRWNGTASVRRDGGDLSVGEAGAPIGLDTLAVDARITDDRIDARGTLRAQVANGRFEGSVLPVDTPEGMRLAPSSPVRLAANIELDRLAALAGLVETSFRVDGRVRAALSAEGTVSDPLLTGRIEGDALSLAYPPEGVALRDGELRARLEGREIRLESFSIIGGEGVFRARGTFARGREEERAAVQWEAERLRIMGRPDRRLVVTGRGTAALEGGKVSLSGELSADEGLIELRAATLPAPGDDVVVEGRQRPPAETPRLQRTALDLTLDFGRNFRIRGRGLDTLLAGKIRILSGPAGNLLAKGAVRTVKGTYTAFGQRLELERGRLVFDGPLENPALDIRAMRKMPSVEAGVEVAGTLRAPFVRVVSDPPMPENDALSWLILGHGPGEASGGDLTMLPMAAAALLGRNESPGSGVARRLGVDSIGLRRGGSVGEQFVTVGKRLSDDIYVVYEQSLGATANVLKLEFNLTRRLLLRAETGETSAIGLFYRWAFD